MRRARSAVLLSAALTCAGVAGCEEQQRPTHRTQLVAGGVPEIGELRFAHYGCTSCHAIPGIPGATAHVGPPLKGWADRRFVAGEQPNVPDRLIGFIMHPQQVAPGTAMPDMGVTEADARHMAAYLYTLK